MLFNQVSVPVSQCLIISQTCVTVMAIQAVFIVFISSVLALSAAQFCGSLSCSQQYDAGCPLDESAGLYDTCRTTQSSCSEPIGPTDNLSVDCYDTCIIGNPTPLQCCANSITAPETISLTTDPNFLIARLFSPDSPGAYSSNRFCKYNIQCPNENFNLHYTMVRFNVEPPMNGQCLDFLRYQFTATGANAPTDACGNLNSLPGVLTSGVHDSGLMVDFRSNRITTGVDFFLAITCTLPMAGAAQDSNGLVAPFSAGPSGPQDSKTWKCTPSQNLRRVVGTVPNSKTIPAKQYLNRVFRGKFSSRIYRYVTVTRAGVVVYKDNTVTVVYEGKIQHRFRNIKLLQVSNRIEGYLRFYGRASPKGRTFPGFGFLQVRRGVVQYIQTILDPKFLLNAEEECIVRQLHQEIFNRQRFSSKRGVYYSLRHPGKNQRVNCSINRLAELNIQACTDVVRAAATFFLENDKFQNYCNRKG